MPLDLCCKFIYFYSDNSYLKRDSYLNDIFKDVIVLFLVLKRLFFANNCSWSLQNYLIWDLMEFYSKLLMYQFILFNILLRSMKYLVPLTYLIRVIFIRVRGVFSWKFSQSQICQQRTNIDRDRDPRTNVRKIETRKCRMG